MGYGRGERGGVKQVLEDSFRAERIDRLGLHPALAAGMSWLLLGLVNLACVNLFGQAPRSVGVRLAHHLIDLGRHASLGLLIALLVWAWGKYGLRGRHWALLAAFCALVGVGYLVLPNDLAGIVERNQERLKLSDASFNALLIVAIAAGCLPALEFARLANRRLWRWLSLPIAACVYAVNATFASHANEGLHFFLSVLTAIALFPVASALVTHWQLATRLRPAALSVVIGLGFAWGLGSVFAPQSNSVVLDLSNWDTSLLATTLREAVVSEEDEEDEEREESEESEDDERGRSEPQDEAARINQELARNAGPFFQSRSELPPIPATGDSPLPKDGVVVLVTLDGLREDLFDGKGKDHMPTMQRLRRQGVYFKNARAPSSETAHTLPAISTGTYYSQQYWTRRKDRGNYWMFQDENPQLASSLSQGGVFTAYVPAVAWMQQSQGLLRGFDLNEHKKTKDRWAVNGEDLTNRILEVLRKHPKGPLFIFCHYLDSHSPYEKGGTTGPMFDRYLGALDYLDTQLARIAKQLDTPEFKSRSLFIVSSDHGEAFGEHSTTHHASTVYDELLRVPLIFKGLNLAPAVRDELVSLVDLGPTILDLYGLATPPSFMGESLQPLLIGKSRQFQRPIVAEGRKKRAMVFADGYKVIQNQRSRTWELYNLGSDPREKRNLSDEVDIDSEPHIALLRAFFVVHTLKKKGYKHPFRK